MTDVNENHMLLSQLESWRTDPGNVQQILLDMLEAGSDGEHIIVDPTTPVVGLLEGMVITAVGNMDQTRALMRRVYPIMATDQSELYLHMSDVDFLNRFGSPARTTFIFACSKAELYQFAIASEVPNVRKAIIPRDTEFSIGEYVFTTQYPIEMRIMPHNGLQIVYDVSEPSPIQPLESNVVRWNAYSDADLEMLRIEIPVLQVKVTRTYEGLSATGAFTYNASFPDYYYYTRVYMSDILGNWKEIKTTHTDQVYDPSKVTAVLKVMEGYVQVIVPPIYFTNGSVGNEIRIDVFSTKGPLDFDAEAFVTNEYKMIPVVADKDPTKKYSDVLSEITIRSVFAYGRVIGGSKEVSFEELRERVIYGSLSNQARPITEHNLATSLSDLGYKSVKNVDVVTERIYLATRALPNPNLANNSSGAGCAIASFSAKMSDLAELPTVRDNFTRVTLLPSTLFRNTNGLISIVPKGEVDTLLTYSKDALAAAVNQNNFLYTPFHYVFDATDNRFSIRPYHLDAPRVENKQFIFENASAAIEVSTRTYGFFKRDYGFEFIVVTRSGDSYKTLPNSRCFAQLSYRGVDETAYAHLNGDLIGIDPLLNERSFSFKFETTFDINSKDEIYINNFKMFSEDTVRELATNLLSDFFLSYIVTDLPLGVEVTPFDNQVATFLLPDTIQRHSVVVREQFSLRIGYALPYLWQASRPIISEEDYERYPSDVPLLYAVDEYQRNPDGSRWMTIVNNEIQFNKLHSAGDPVLDENNEPIMRFKAGDLVYVNDEPVLKNPRQILSIADMFFIDGRYYFATQTNTVAYAKEIPMTVVEWCNTDIAKITESLIEETKLYFYPITTTGNIRIIGESSDPITVPCEQSLNVQLYVDKVTNDNTLLKVDISQSVRKQLDTELQRRTVSLLDIAANLRAILGEGVFGASITGLGGNRQLNTMTVLDDSQRAMLRKRLVVDNDGFLSVQDDITIEFKLHAQQ